MAVREHPRYSNFEFEAWTFREFPLMVWPDNPKDPREPLYYKTGRQIGKPKDGVIVNSEAELAEVLGLEPPEPEAALPARTLVRGPSGTKKLQSEEDQKGDAIDEATRLGVKVDARWSTARILDAIATHKANAQSGDDEPPV